MAGKSTARDEKSDVAMRVIADHIRAIAFSIADGQLPSNVKAGYVIRRILRRAVRYGYTFLGQKQAFMYKLLPVLIENMGAAYPELNAQKELIAKVIKEEEEVLPAHSRDGYPPAGKDHGRRQSRRQEQNQRKGRLHFIRHLRFPDRPDGADSPRKRHDCRHQGVRRRNAAAETACPQRRCHRDR